MAIGVHHRVNAMQVIQNLAHCAFCVLMENSKTIGAIMRVIIVQQTLFLQLTGNIVSRVRHTNQQTQAIHHSVNVQRDIHVLVHCVQRAVQENSKILCQMVFAQIVLLVEKLMA